MAARQGERIPVRLLLGTCAAWLSVVLMAVGYLGFILLVLLQAVGVTTGAAPLDVFSGSSILLWVQSTPLALILLGLGFIGTLGLVFTVPLISK